MENHQLTGEHPEWPFLRMRHWLPPSMHILVSQHFDVREYSAIVYLSKTFHQIFQQFNLPVLASIGELWLEYVDGIDKDAPEYYVTLLTTERKLIADIAGGSTTAERVIYKLASAFQDDSLYYKGAGDDAGAEGIDKW